VRAAAAEAGQAAAPRAPVLASAARTIGRDLLAITNAG
jgi:hypothetical protein